MCQGWFRAEIVLQQHMAKIHFWTKLLALPLAVTTAQGEVYQCPELPCLYIHANQNIIAGHLAVSHKVVFRIALEMFPNFQLPVLPNDDVVILSPVKRSLPTSGIETSEGKVMKTCLTPGLTRPVLLPSPPSLPVARITPSRRTETVSESATIDHNNTGVDNIKI